MSIKKYGVKQDVLIFKKFKIDRSGERKREDTMIQMTSMK